MIEPLTTPEADRFGDYVLVGKIAQGGMAELFLAKRPGAEGFEKTLAIKRILPELSGNREFVTMFINEAKIAARLSHPNIVQIFDFGKVDLYYFIAMEYVHGENLRTILNRAMERHAPMPPDLAAFIVARACAGLEHAHKKLDERGKPLRIVHRDVSPQNILVSYEGEVKVVDFGIAKALAESPEATRGVLKGKLAYLSPEQVTGKNVDPRTDIFAVGLVFCELLTGQKVFDQKDTAEILNAIARIDSSEVARSVAGLHKSLREVLRRSLHADPAGRFSSAGEMQLAVEDYLRERTDTGGTLQLTSYMQLLFDEKIGEKTLFRLRSEVFGGTPEPKAGFRVPSSRVTAAAAGAMAAVIALAIAAPGKKPAVEAPPVRELAEEKPVPTLPTPPPAPVPGTDEIARASAALAGGKTREAITAFEKAFALDSGLRSKHAAAYGRALSDEGRRLLEAGSDEAASRFQAALQVAPDLFDPHFYLAKIYWTRRDSESALREYREAVRIDPTVADAQYNLGYVYFSQKLYDQALRQYEKVVELKPAYLGDVFYNIAACYEQMGKKREAIEALRRGIEAVPGSELLQQRLKQLGG